MSLDADERASNNSRFTSRRKIRYSRRNDIAHDHALTPEHTDHPGQGCRPTSGTPQDARSGVSTAIAGQVSGRKVGILPITVLSSNYGLMSVQIHLDCDRGVAALEKWQFAMYELLQGAYFEMLRAYQEEKASRDVKAGVTIEGRSPLANANIVREELKRQVVNLLLGVDVAIPVDLVKFDPDGRPSLNIEDSNTSAQLIQFVEELFE